MSEKYWREWLLGSITVAAISAVFWVPPIPQDPAYHAFADRRILFSAPNFWNIFSNLSFVLVGIYGLSCLSCLPPFSPRLAYVTFCSGLILIGLGSMYYHYAPSTETLLWDRLPMTISFMALFSMIIHDRISERFGSALLWPLVITGMSSVGYWYWTELQGRGDLRAYGVIQFLPMLLTPLMLILYTGKRFGTSWLWAMLGTYALAKVMEHFDADILVLTGVISGHSIKHMLAALAVLWVVLAVLQKNSAGFHATQESE